MFAVLCFASVWCSFLFPFFSFFAEVNSFYALIFRLLLKVTVDWPLSMRVRTIYGQVFHFVANLPIFIHTYIHTYIPSKKNTKKQKRTRKVTRQAQTHFFLLKKVEMRKKSSIEKRESSTKRTRSKCAAGAYTNYYMHIWNLRFDCTYFLDVSTLNKKKHKAKKSEFSLYYKVHLLWSFWSFHFCFLKC